MSPESDPGADGAAPPLLQIVGLHASVDGQPILRGIDLTVGSGKVHAIMGPNGSGKSTLANVLLGNPAYEVTSGSILFHGEDITSWSTDVRGKAGHLPAFQDPESIGGVPVIQFLRQALSARRGMDMSVLEVRLMMMEWMESWAWTPPSASATSTTGTPVGRRSATRSSRWPCSSPSWPSSTRRTRGSTSTPCAPWPRRPRGTRVRPDLGVLVVTHYQRILEELAPDRVHVLVDGRIVEEGGPELARLEAEGYEAWRT